MKLLRLAILATLLFSFNNVWAATLTANPTFTAQGGALTVTWSAVAAPTNTDWIGLYAPASGDSGYFDWLYVNSCGKSAGASALATGSCSFVIPSSLSNGTYEFRLFAANGYGRLATSASFSVSPVPPSTRFVDNGDGTISDTQTGLMWEKKTGSVGTRVNCITLSTCPDPHNVNNNYVWSSSGTAPDGPLFTDFLARINTELSTSTDGSTVVDVCFAGHCDWRIPDIAELRTILLAQPASLLAPAPCAFSPSCIHPIFGPSATDLTPVGNALPTYVSSTTFPQGPGHPPSVWSVAFGDGSVNFSAVKNVTQLWARAVRGYR